MIINPDYVCFGKGSSNDNTFSLNEFNLKNSNEETIFGMKIDLNLTFNSHIKTSYTKAGQNLCSFLSISNYLDQNKKNFSIDQ